MKKNIITQLHTYWLNIVLLSLLSLSSTYGQVTPNYIFDIKHLSVEDGLPDRFVYRTKQDHKGFLWMSTPGHICRYDGYQFKQYESELFGLPDNVYPSFEIDPNNQIWCFLDKGSINSVVIFNPVTEAIVTLKTYFESNLPFEAIDISSFIPQKTADSSYFLIHLKNGDLYNYDGISFHKLPLKVSQLSPYLPHILIHNNSIWAIEALNLSEYSMRGELINRIPLPNNTSSALKIFNNDLLLFTAKATSNPNIYDNNIFTVQNNTLSNKLSATALNGRFIWTQFNFLESELLWLINGKTLFAYNQDYQKVFEYTMQSVISENAYLHVHTIFSDRQENTWISTTEGVFIVPTRKNPFRQLIKGVSTRGIQTIEDSILFVANYSGDKCVNLSSEEVKNGFFGVSGLLGISSNLDSTKLFICYGARYFCIFDKKTKQKTAFKNYNSEDSFTAIETINSKKIIIATNRGLSTLDTINHKIIPFRTNNEELNKARINHLYQNKSGIWVASNTGIFLMNEKGQILEIIHEKYQLPPYNYFHIHEDKAGVFWLATANHGLVEWHPNQQGVNIYNQSNGLFNETIYAVIEDKYNNLWLPSDYGLIRFNRKTKISNTYLMRDGLSHVEFNFLSHFQDKKTDNIFLGGLNGVIQFSPDDFLQDTTSNIPIQITSYKVLRSGKNELEDLTTTAVQDKKITIYHNDNFFELRFALMDFVDSKQNKYAYKIEGYDKDWNYIQENFIRITSLPYGNYTLKIKGQGDKGQWSSHILSIQLVSKPPFYWTWWFIFTGVGLMVLSIFLWLKWRTYNLQKDREQLEIEVQRRTAIIQEQTEALKALDKAKTRFFSNITHEFRTPLTLIIGPVEQMLKRTNADWMKRNLQLVQRNTQQLFDLINQLLDVSKMEAGKMALVLSSGDLNLFLKETLETFQPLAINKNISLDYKSDFDEFLADFDKNKIQKIVNNLLSNAIKYTNNGGEVTLGFKTDNFNNIQIIVSDNGQGISSAHQKMIFERFFQVDDSSTRQGEGTGIGLALVQELVLLMNGRIDLESKLQVGSIFTITLPIRQKVFNHLSHPATNTPKKSADTLIILLIEDNTDMRNYIKSCLTDSKYQIIEAEDGQKGLEIAYEEIPDLIISDVMMPLKNGFEVAQGIRNNIKTSHIPIILLTAKTALENRIKGFEMGADAYLNKPFNSTELNTRINNLIELRKELQSKYQSSEVNIKHSESETLQKEDAFIIELQNLTLSELQNPELNGDYLGHLLGMSRMQLHRKLKALTNQSVGEFIKIIRLNKAMELLQSSDKNVTETAYEVGFTSPSQLSRNFKAHFGISPSKVKK